MPSSAARSCPLCLRIVGLRLPVLAQRGFGRQTFGRVYVAESGICELRGLEPRTERWEMALELRFLSFGVVTRVLRFLRICVGVLRHVTVLDRLVWRLTARG